MLVVETVAKIRREHFGRGKGMKTIARELGLSRNTVRKVLRSGETSFEYERTEQPHPKLGAFIGRLEAMLETNASGARKDRLTLTRIADLLGREGYDGGYDAVRRYAGRWTAKRRGVSSPVEAFVPLSFAPSDAYQVSMQGKSFTTKPLSVRASFGSAPIRPAMEPEGASPHRTSADAGMPAVVSRARSCAVTKWAFAFDEPVVVAAEAEDRAVADVGEPHVGRAAHHGRLGDDGLGVVGAWRRRR